MENGQIIQLLAGFYDVLTDEGKVIRTRARGNFRKNKISPLVGDFVEFKTAEDDTGYITSILDRKNTLVRPPLANIDQAIVVTACVEPDFSSNLLDRQLVALEEKHIQPQIYFSKTDLLNTEQVEHFQEISDYYQSIGYSVYFEPDAFSASNLKKLRNSFKDQLTIFMGQTGAGKSTLLNHIDPALNIETGAVSQALNRGKHTTRKVSLLPIDGGLVADTPGFSTYAVFEMDEYELKEDFVDFVHYAANCQFRECLHLNEPNCGVKKALDEGKILESRYQNYLQFMELIRAQKPKYKQKGYQKKTNRRKSK
ncbi:ribosome small subunit-dependent GTPase A [Pediococcus argentinicus]|uniref:Small ribosomal subunit biogenesis GTPase RsgA n=1 Tax=Pediococcus argentinicus TaxID=480391 RepID=A0A0R2NH70_9LACO|nr:ribosome small subunit-dependent GTPase A [Pediococcus argentinicus]KRO25169.1 GTPase [Pediococcus argentinicus]NKZ22427.1 ribosome small subunit-dependent GTPase A [Pediococcus argentinicus]GEP19527.1 putative ribosome biogenesis GTPase RsgA 1 [Pediococcus argentinicus]